MTLADAIKIRELLIADPGSAQLGLATLSGFEKNEQEEFFQLMSKDITSLNRLIRHILPALQAHTEMPALLKTFEDFVGVIQFLLHTRDKFNMVSLSCRKFLIKNRFQFVEVQNFEEANEARFKSKTISVCRVEQQYFLSFGISPDGGIERCLGLLLG
jgi:hypothetical protein